ncbi:MAG TPA: hypothetical protein VFC07_13200 [Verrucomicrobiae bacterium]|nr:hypothetical protein [Verrucomicrobiae bacterium]
MQANIPELEQKVFDCLDGIIRDHGDYLFMGLVFLLIPLSIWVLSGGLRRKLLKGRPMPSARPTIIIHQTEGRPAPHAESFNSFPPYQEPTDCNCDDE